MRGRRIGTRPVSAHSGTQLSLGDEEEDFEDLNGQIGSKIQTSKDQDPGRSTDIPGITSDYGSASDVVTYPQGGSRTEALSSLEENQSMRSKTPGAENASRRASTDTSRIDSIDEELKDLQSTSPQDISPTKSRSSPRIKVSHSSAGKVRDSNDSGKESDEDAVDMDDIAVDLEGGTGGGAGNVSFESWPPQNSDAVNLNDDAGQEEEEEVVIDVFPKGLSAFGKADYRDESRQSSQSSPSKAPVDQQPSDFSSIPKLPDIGMVSPAAEKTAPAPHKTAPQQESPPSPLSSPSKAPSQAPADDKVTRTPLPSIPPVTLETPALTRPVKLPGIDMKTKGGAAEITEDSGLLKNYVEPKTKKKSKKKKGAKKDQGKADAGGSDGKPPKKVKKNGSSPKHLDQRVSEGIEAAIARSTTPTSKTPIPLPSIRRDSSKDSSPISSGYSTPIMDFSPSREFQGALMAAKKIRETTQLDGKIPGDIREHPVAETVAEKFGMEMKVRDEDDNKLSVKERRELARQRRKEEADRKRRERDEEKKRHKEEEERKLAEEADMQRRKAEREAELAAERQRELQRRKEEEARRRQEKLEERERKKREEEKMMDAKKRLEEELRKRREAEAARLAEIERQKELQAEREREEAAQRAAEAEKIRAEMEEEMAREMLEYERKVREEEERKRIEDALKAEAERRLLDADERKRIIALARHLWNKGVRIEGTHLEQELEISSIFYSYFNYLESQKPFDGGVDISYKDKMLQFNMVKKVEQQDGGV